jgi:F0F1-type ATP synthase assembly protein I
MSDSPRKSVGSAARQFALATELPFLLVAGVAVGGVLGYFLDRWWHTKPAMMLVLGAVGFFAGVRELLRRLAKSDTDPSSGGGSGS